MTIEVEPREAPSDRPDDETEAPPPAQPPRSHARPSRISQLPGWVVEGGAAGVTALISLVVARWVLGVPISALTKPIDYMGDALFYEATVKGVTENGWYLVNPDLGAPLSLHSHGFPLLSNDSLQLVIVRFLGLFFDSPFTITNLFFVLTFPLCALTAYWALRRMHLSIGTTIVCASLYAVLPFHFLRGIPHLFYTSYYAVPLGCFLVFCAVTGEAIFQRNVNRRGPLSLITKVTLRTLLLCAVIASASLYYALFTMLLVLVASVLRALSGRRWRAAVPGLAVVTLIGVALALNLTPNLIDRYANGANDVVTHRRPADSEYFALKIDQLLMPIAGHRLEPLAEVADKFQSTTPLISEPSGNLGAIGSIGFIALLLAGLLPVLGATARRRFPTAQEHDVGVVVLVSLLVATVGGLSGVLAYTVSPLIRSWNRMSIFIALFSLWAVGLLLDRVRRRVASRGRIGQTGFAALLVVVLGVGILDQTSGRYSLDVDQYDSTFAAVDSFVKKLEAGQPDGAMMLQLPYVPFPEHPPVNEMSHYEHLRPYLSSTHLRWSYASLKGSKDDWHLMLEHVPLRALLDSTIAAGFSGVVVNRHGYADGGTALARAITSLVGKPTLTSADKVLTYWDLRPYGADLEARTPAEAFEAMGQAATHPPELAFGQGVFGLEGAGDDRWRWSGPASEITFNNRNDEAVPMLIDTIVGTDAPKAGDLDITFPDGTSKQIRFTRKGTPLHERFEVPPGRSKITFRADATVITDGDGAQLAFRMANVMVFPEALCNGTPATTGDPALDAIPTDVRCMAGSRPQVP